MTPKEARDLLSRQIALTVQLAAEGRKVDVAGVAVCLDDFEAAVRREEREKIIASLRSDAAQCEAGVEKILATAKRGPNEASTASAIAQLRTAARYLRNVAHGVETGQVGKP